MLLSYFCKKRAAQWGSNPPLLKDLSVKLSNFQNFHSLNVSILKYENI